MREVACGSYPPPNPARVLDRLDAFVSDCPIYLHGVICRVTAESGPASQQRNK